MRVLITMYVLLVFVTTLHAQVTRQEIKKIDEIVDKAYKTFKPTGLTIAVVKDTAIIYHKALGFSNADLNKSVSTGSLFNIASCTKAFTAACISILVDEEKLRWTDKVTAYFPEFRLADDYITRELTVEDLLCHRSGLGTFFGDLLWYNTTYTDEEVMKRIRIEPITKRFGIEFGYQNIMFMIAGDIIQKVTGQTWSEFVESRIFKPLGMNETRPSSDELSPDQDIAYGHINNKKIDLYKFTAAKPAASIFSNVDELSLWTILILQDGVFKGNRIISSASIEKLLEPHTILDASTMQKQHGTNFFMYGLGWFISDYHGEKIAEHDGGMPGYISKVTLVPEKKISIIILNNGNDGYVNNAIRSDLLDLFTTGNDYDWISEYAGMKIRVSTYEFMANQKRLDSRIKGTQPSLDPAGYIGIYRDRNYGDAEVKVENGKLLLTFLPAKKIFTGVLEHWHYNTFKVVFKDESLSFGLITFSFDSSGKVVEFKIDLPSGDFHFWNLDFKKIK